MQVCCVGMPFQCSFVVERILHVDVQASLMTSRMNAAVSTAEIGRQVQTFITLSKMGHVAADLDCQGRKRGSGKQSTYVRENSRFSLLVRYLGTHEPPL